MSKFGNFPQDGLAVRKTLDVRPVRAKLSGLFALVEIGLSAPVCHRPLLVCIDDDHGLPTPMPGGSEGDGRGALPNAPLVVRYGEDHRVSMPARTGKSMTFLTSKIFEVKNSKTIQRQTLLGINVSTAARPLRARRHADTKNGEFPYCRLSSQALRARSSTYDAVRSSAAR